MENLNAEQIKKALECCTTLRGCCYPCPYGDIGAGCQDKMCGDALSLIKELAEENERLKLDVEVCGAELSRYTENIVQMAKQDRADTVRKMQERLKERFNTASRYTKYSGAGVVMVIDQIAKEMLEET